MSEFKGTRGPWKAVYNCDWEDGANATSIYSVDGVYVADVYRGYVGSEDLTEAEQKANARLIAAAPELLEALCNTRRAIQALIDNGYTGYVDLRSSIDATIAKAIGEE